MVGFLSAHGTNPNIFSGQFQDLSFSFADDVITDDCRESLEWVSIDDLIDTADEPHEEPFDSDFEMTSWSSPYLGSDYDWNDDFDTYSGIALSADGAFFSYEDYPAWLEVPSTNRAIWHELSNSFMPAFSSNREPHHRLTYEEDDARWHRRCIRSNRHNRGRKQAKWRSDNGKLARKDSSRWSLRHAQVAMSDWYYLEHQAYTAEDYLGEHLAMLAESDQAFYQADYVRFVAKCDRDADSHFDPVTQSDLVQETWLRALFPERFEPIRAYRFSDMDYYDDCYGHDDSWAYHEDSEQDESESSFMSAAYQWEMRQLRLLGIEEPICVNGLPINYWDGETYAEEEWASAENDNDDEVLIGSFKGLTRTNIIGRQNRSALNRQLMFG